MVETPLPPAARCPFCGGAPDTATHPLDDSRTPRENDASFCLGCARWAIFRADLTLRMPSEKETAEIMATPDAKRIMQAWVVNRLEGTFNRKRRH